jgi:hypothetical protein
MENLVSTVILSLVAEMMRECEVIRAGREVLFHCSFCALNVRTHEADGLPIEASWGHLGC